SRPQELQNAAQQYDVLQKHFLDARANFLRQLEQTGMYLDLYPHLTALFLDLIASRTIARPHTRSPLLPYISRMPAELPQETLARQALAYLFALCPLPSQNNARAVSIQTLSAERPVLGMQMPFLRAIVHDCHARAANAAAVA